MRCEDLYLRFCAWSTYSITTIVAGEWLNGLIFHDDIKINVLVTTIAIADK